MTDAKAQLLDLKDKFIKASDEDKIIILNEMKVIKVTKEVLMSTSVGLAVNKFRKSENEELRNLVKALVTFWKKATLGGATPAKKASKPAKPAKTEKPAVVAADEPVMEEEPSAKAVQLGNTGDDIRDKVQQMMFKAVEGKDGVSAEKAKALGFEIEDALFEKHKDSGRVYREDIRTILFNLRDKSNPLLIQNVITGVVTPVELVNKDPAELASEETKRRRLEEQKEAIDAARCDWEDENGGWLDSVQCPNCMGWKTKHNQKQIRGADEPMTTFHVCGDCKYRWTDGDH